MSLWQMVGWSLDVSASTIAINAIVQGFGLGFVFVPLNTIAFASLPGDLRTEGAALWTLIRNIGSSVGISVVIAELTSMIGEYHSQLAEHVTPFNDALHMPNAGLLSGMGLPSLETFGGDRHPAGRSDGLFERLSADGPRLAVRLPAARADPLAQGRTRSLPRGGARGVGVGASELKALAAVPSERRSFDGVDIPEIEPCR